MRRTPIARTLALAVGVLALAAAAAGYGLLAASLPRHAGAAPVPGLAAPVRVELDDLAVPRIRASSLTDAFRAQGYLHAQQRFFEMDLTRRSAAGELAALVGEAALPLDRQRRPLQFRARARALLASLPARQRSWLAAYADGVNAGLADLGSRPPSYWALGSRPQPWKPEDSLLVAYAFYTQLSDNQAYEKPQGVMRATLPASVYRFLTPSTSRFDRPLLGATATDPTGGYRPDPLPPAADLGPALAPPSSSGPLVRPPLAGSASNEWAVAAARSASGRAMLANDPHLELRLPNAFYRSELYWNGHVARGVGIPGLPGIVVGATERLAWGVTVSYADQSDWVVVETAPGDPSRYLVPGGTEPFRVDHERIDVRGESPVGIDVQLTRWGPVLDRDWRGRPLALHATWFEPDGLDLDMLELLSAPDATAAVRLVAGWAGPSLNWIFADAGGHIAWTVNGPLPERRGFDGSSPTSWADGQRGWSGRLPSPRVVDPPDGVLYTANNRTVAEPDADGLSRIWMRPVRAKRIAEQLASKPRLDESDLLAIQLDTRAEAYDLIRDIALEVLGPAESEPDLARARARIAGWNGRADVDQVGFRLLQIYYRVLRERLLAPLLVRARAADPHFVYRWPLADEPLRRLLETRPPELLPPAFADWRAYLRAVLVDAVRALETEPKRFGPDATWGDVNRLDVAHPLARVPLLGHWLRLPASPLPGSRVSVRVATPDFGAVFRMVVAPSAPERGVLEMAGGQSGHFLSRHFEDQQAAWVAGSAAPFLAGPTARSFVLDPPPRQAAASVDSVISAASRAR